jgi:virulence factor Mce-like protein
MGTIVDVQPRPDGVRLVMELDAAVKIPASARLSIVPITVISDRYVQLTPPYRSGPTMQDGDHISLGRTSIPAELEDVLTQLKELLAALEPAPGEKRGPLARLIREVDATFVGAEDDLRGTLQGSAAVLENLADSGGDINGLIANLDQLFVALANRSSEIGLVNERFQLVSEALLADSAHLEGTIENVAELSNAAYGLVDESGRDIARTFRRLENVLDHVLESEDQLVEGMRWTNVIAQAFGATDANGRGLFAYTGRQGAPEYSYRLDQRDTITCRRIHLVAETVVRLVPGSTQINVVNTLLSHVPNEYDEHLKFLIAQLVDLCASDIVPASVGAPRELDTRTMALVNKVAARIGPYKMAKLLTRWMLTGEEAGA